MTNAAQPGDLYNNEYIPDLTLRTAPIAVLLVWETNIKIAQTRWAKVRQNKVSKDLGGWTCGSAACFGGWLTEWPEFAALGIERDGGDAPSIPASRMHRGMHRMRKGISWHGSVSASDIALLLFGNPLMFARRGHWSSTGLWSAETPKTSSEITTDRSLPDHTIVVERLYIQLRRVQARIDAIRAKPVPMDRSKGWDWVHSR